MDNSEPGGPDNTWNEWSNYVLKELERINNVESEIFGRLNDLEKKMAVAETTLKIKGGMWGFIAGLIPATAALIWFIVSKK